MLAEFRQIQRTAGRRVVANAIGTVKDENVATGASDQYGYGLAGGYIAVNVVNQDVNAIIHDGAVVTAGGDVRVSTRATANVTTSAISSAAQIAEEQMSVGGGFASISKALGQMAWEEIKSWFENDQKKQERIEKLLKSISKSDYSVKLIKTSSENDEKGSATVTTKTRRSGEVSVIVEPQPRSGCSVKNVRYRYLEPSFSNLRHTIAVAECYVQLVELTREYPLLKITEVQWEPECWRPYEFRGEKGILKPDLFVVTEDIGYENRWFIELDLNTEGLPSIVEKCRRYQLLYQTGSEQKAHGIFPYTLWITTDEGRRNRMQEAINEAFGKSARMFRVITADEFRNVMKD